MIKTDYKGAVSGITEESSVSDQYAQGLRQSIWEESQDLSLL